MNAIGLLKRAAAVGLLATAEFTFAGTNLVADPEFDIQIGSGFLDWTLSGSSQPVAGGVCHFVVGHSNYCAYIGSQMSTGETGTGFVSQNIATTPGHLYEVSYWISRWQFGSIFDISASFAGGSISASALSIPNFGSPVQIAGSVSTLSDLTTLSIGGTVSGQAYIDSVSVVDLGAVPAVPEPDVPLLLGIGMACLLLRRHRANLQQGEHGPR